MIAPAPLCRLRFRGATVLSPLDQYLHAIAATPLLTPAEEQVLARRIAAGNTGPNVKGWTPDALAARDHLALANLRLVVSIARSFQYQGLPLLDLIEEGNLGLLHAVEKFDISFGTRFTTYANHWIKQAIQRALVDTVRPIRLPNYMDDTLRKWRQVEADLQASAPAPLGYPPSVEEVARVLDVSRKQLPIVMQALRVEALIFYTDQSDGTWLIDEMVADQNTPEPGVEAAEADNLDMVMHRLGEMDRREAMVLRLWYGLEGVERRNLREIGEMLGVTKERVRQIRDEALGKLRKAVASDGDGTGRAAR